MKIQSIGSLGTTSVGKRIRIRGLIEYEQKTMANGSQHLYGTVNDGTGRISFSAFDDTKWLKRLSSIETKSYVILEGTLETVTGGKTKKNKSLSNIFEITSVNADVTNIDEGAIRSRIKKAYRAIGNDKLKKLVHSFLKRAGYFTSVYNINQFAYKGGLSAYTARLLDVVDMYMSQLENEYERDAPTLEINKDIVIAAVLLHSVGSLVCYEQGVDKLYFETSNAKLHGKDNETKTLLVRAMVQVNMSLEESEKFLHVIETCNHGQERWNRDSSAKTLEAVLLHQAIQFVLTSDSFTKITGTYGENKFTQDVNGYPIQTGNLVKE